MPNETVIEKHTIGYVPPEDRHGKVRDLFTLWFGQLRGPLGAGPARPRRPGARFRLPS